MEDQNKKYKIGSVLIRWSDLKLTPEQAEKIVDFEEVQRPRSLNNILSDWEKWDYEFYIFSSILNPEQSRSYNNERNKRIREHEQELVESDNSDIILRGIERATKEINYLETDFLPAISKKFHRYHSIKDPYQTKYSFLKAEFKNYLDERRSEIISNHFRYNRGFQPNTLNKELLAHKIEAMYPRFAAFEKKMDDVTKSVVEFLQYPAAIFERGKKEMSAILENLSTFRQKAWEEESEWIKEAGIPSFNRYIEDTRSEEDRNKELYFSLLLIDKDYYGYK